MSKVEVVLSAKAMIGESPLWSPEEDALYFIDVKAPALFRLHLSSGDRDRWDVSSDVGAFTLRPDRSAALVALRSGLEWLDFATGALTPVAPAPFDPALFRFNEGGCDPAGGFWQLSGVMFDPADPASPPRRGSLHSYTAADGCSPNGCRRTAQRYGVVGRWQPHVPVPQQSAADPQLPLSRRKARSQDTICHDPRGRRRSRWCRARHRSGLLVCPAWRRAVAAVPPRRHGRSRHRFAPSASQQCARSQAATWTSSTSPAPPTN